MCVDIFLDLYCVRFSVTVKLQKQQQTTTTTRKWQAILQATLKLNTQYQHTQPMPQSYQYPQNMPRQQQYYPPPPPGEPFLHNQHCDSYISIIIYYICV